MAKRPVTLKGVVAGQVSLEIEGFDRVYLNGWVPALQTLGQIGGWLRYRGFPIASPAALGKNKELFVQAVRRYADGNGIGWVRFAKGDRKIEVMQPYPAPPRPPGFPRWWQSGRPGSSSGSSTPRRRPARTAGCGLSSGAASVW